jgi:N-acetylmuramoyl-L-alanine amidase
VKGFFGIKARLAALGLAVCCSVGLLPLAAWGAEPTTIQGAPLVFIDPGHGGIDGGAYKGQVKEKDVNLAVALKLGKSLENQGFRVQYSRTTDTDICSKKGINPYHFRKDLLSRVELAKEAGASIFVSIHCNSTRNTKALGPMTFFHGQAGGKELAYQIQKELNQLVTSKLGKCSRNPQEANYLLLREMPSPAALVELGFLI